MKTQTQTSTKMFKSKVDIETSDIFFNYGAKSYLAACSESNLLGKVFDDEWERIFDNDILLKTDATAFLEIVIREDLTVQDLVDDFRARL